MLEIFSTEPSQYSPASTNSGINSFIWKKRYQIFLQCGNYSNDGCNGNPMKVHGEHTSKWKNDMEKLVVQELFSKDSFKFIQVRQIT